MLTLESVVVGFGSVIGFGLYLLNWYGWTALILWIIYSNWSESSSRPPPRKLHVLAC